MTRKLDAVYDLLQDGGVLWTVDHPSLPGSSVQSFGYRQGRQFTVQEASEVLRRLLELQDLGLALGLQTVPERDARARVIKWRRASASHAAAAVLSRAPAMACPRDSSEPTRAGRPN